MHRVIFILVLLLFSACRDTAWNNPYSNTEDDTKVLYSSFTSRPKHLDPARSYSSNEWSIISQVYESPLQYDYLKRPYRLVTSLAEEMPTVNVIEENGQKYSIYKIKIKPGIRFQDHPAFVSENRSLDYDELVSKKDLESFSLTSSREVTAEDFVFQIKRLADPKINSPIYGLMSSYIIGLQELRKSLVDSAKNVKDIGLEGAYTLDKYTYEIKIKGNYPQFVYWLAMPFFSPMPWEAIEFYNQEGLEEHNISLDWYPVGTGPYILTENDPSQRMTLSRNNNFRDEFYPDEGEGKDEELGLLVNKGKKLPFVDKVIFSLEKESIPYWNKFLQGYYDTSGISSDNFNNVFTASGTSGLTLNQDLLDQGIRVQSAISPTTMYWGFNMLDEVVGGYTEDKVALRHAISIAFNVEEYIAIFLNGRAEVAMHPIPPDLLSDNYNNYVTHRFSEEEVRRIELNRAKELLASAGYPGGRNVKTGEPLSIYFEAIGSGDPNERAVLSWTRKQLAKLGIELVVRATDYNRFQDKMQNGSGQIFFWGWNADYPDPENFLFMFYSKNAKAQYGGENAVNYQSEEFDKLFEELNLTRNSAEKKELIEKMLAILQYDSPWIWGYHPHSYTLYHKWYLASKQNPIARNTVKYIDINPKLRYELQKRWNTPSYTPLIFMLFVTILLLFLSFIYYLKRLTAKARRL